MPQNPPQLTAWPLISPADIPPAPVPTQISVGQVRNGSETMVVMQVVTPSGVQTYFIEHDVSVQVGRMLQSAGSGIVIAPAAPPSPIMKG